MHTFTLPSGPEVGIVEMTGVEEDLLTNQHILKAIGPIRLSPAVVHKPPCSTSAHNSNLRGDTLRSRRVCNKIDIS